MIRLLDRYLLREFLVPLGYCLGGFLITSIVFDLFATLADFQKRKLGGADIAHYYWLKTPEFLVLVLPIALLLALLYTLTNHARHHEITAMRAAGISLWRICLPYLGIGLLASAAVFAVNEYWVPMSDDAAEAIKTKNQQIEAAGGGRLYPNLGFNNAQGGRLWKVAQYNMDTGEMLKPQVRCAEPDGSYLWLYADRGERLDGVWTFHNAREYRTVVGRPDALPTQTLSTNLLTKPEFSETPEQIRSEIKISAALSLRRAKKADVPIREILNYLRLHPRPSPSEASWLYTKLHGRLAIPCTCLVVVLIAVPFGAASGRRNVFVGVASSLVICFTYFVLQQFCLALGTGGHVPPWVAGWFPNLAFGLAGLWLTSRVR